MGLSQIHNKSDFNDIVLRKQISKILQEMVPRVSSILAMTCRDDTMRGPSLVEASIKALGRFLCLVFEDYEKKQLAVSTADFKMFFESSEKAKVPSNSNISTEWYQNTSKKIAEFMVMLKSLRGNEYDQIRHEMAVMSWNLLYKCLPNIQTFTPILIENLILCADDSNASIREFSEKSMLKLPKLFNNLNTEICDLFAAHLNTLPRHILTGDDQEQIAALSLLNSYIKITSGNAGELHFLLENSTTMERVLNFMLSCCELDVPNDLLLYENLSSGSLCDQYYQMKKPWKQFKHLNNDSVIKKFSEVCRNLGKSVVARQYINHLLDNINSLEYLVLLIEIIDSESQLDKDQIECIIEEFLDDIYWSMPTKLALPMIEIENQKSREEWYKDSTPGLYESSVEVRLKDIKLDDKDIEKKAQLRHIKYNILCTCLVNELIGQAATVLKTEFQRYMLRVLHRILEKAGNLNFIIRTSSLFALESIKNAMGYNEMNQLIDGYADFLMFNIHKMLKRDRENESVLDMMSVVMKFSRSSMTSSISDIVFTVTEQLGNNQFAGNTIAYLKLFKLYVTSVQQWNSTEYPDKQIEKISTDKDLEWNEFLEQCYSELDEVDFVIDGNQNEDFHPDNNEEAQEAANQNEEVNNNPEPPEISPHIKLILKIMSTTVQYFASNDQNEVILVHEIFLKGIPIICLYEEQFLPLVHQMWYPFTKQFQVKNTVMLQSSFRLLILIAEHAKDFIYKRSMNDVIPTIKKFLTTTVYSTDGNLSYTQQFKLQLEILQNLGQLTADLGIDNKELDDVLEILLKFSKHSNELLSNASSKSINVIKSQNPMLVHLKMNF